MTKFYDTDSEARWWVGIYGRLVLAVILIALIVGGFYVFSVATATTRGRADQHRQQQSSTNRIFAQQQFHDLYTDYQATTAKLPIYKQQAASGDAAAQTNLTGIESHCLDVVGQYNAASEKFLSRDFKDADLPTSLDSASCH